MPELLSAVQVIIDELLIQGFMPELYRENSRESSVYYHDYLNTCVEKDLREMLEVKNLDKFLRFEIKTTMTPNRSFSRNLLSFVDAEENAKNPKIIYTGQSYPQFNGVEYVNFKDTKKYRMF